jgi:hypothetical protein
MIAGFDENVPKSSDISPTTNLRPPAGRVFGGPTRKGRHVIIVLVLAVVILAVALLGVLVVMRVGMTRERDRFLTNQPPTRTAGAARAICGLHVRMPGRDTHAQDSTARFSACARRSPASTSLVI